MHLAAAHLCWRYVTTTADFFFLQEERQGQGRGGKEEGRREERRNFIHAFYLLQSILFGTMDASYSRYHERLPLKMLLNSSLLALDDKTLQRCKLILEKQTVV